MNRIRSLRNVQNCFFRFLENVGVFRSTDYTAHTATTRPQAAPKDEAKKPRRTSRALGALGARRLHLLVRSTSLRTSLVSRVRGQVRVCGRGGAPHAGGTTEARIVVSMSFVQLPPRLSSVTPPRPAPPRPARDRIDDNDGGERWRWRPLA